MVRKYRQKQVLWAADSFPAFARLGLSEVEKVVVRSERGIMTVRAAMIFFALFVSQFIAPEIALRFGYKAYGWVTLVSFALVLAPLALLAIALTNQLWRWRIRKAVQL